MVERLAMLLPASVTAALWHSYPHCLIGIAEEIAKGDGDSNPTRLWRVEPFGSPRAWAQAVMAVPVAHAAALLYCYLGPPRRDDRLRNALLKESESASHQEQYFDAWKRAKRRSRQNPTLEMAEMVLADTRLNFSSRASAAGSLVMPWAIAVAQPLFVDALKGWRVTSLPESDALSDRINAQIRRNSSGALTLTHRLGRR